MVKNDDRGLLISLDGLLVVGGPDEIAGIRLFRASQEDPCSGFQQAVLIEAADHILYIGVFLGIAGIEPVVVLLPQTVYRFLCIGEKVLVPKVGVASCPVQYDAIQLLVVVDGADPVCLRLANPARLVLV